MGRCSTGRWTTWLRRSGRYRDWETIGEGAIVLAQSGISKSLEGGKTYFGSPCSDVKEKFREMAALRRLPQILDNLK